jgi:hypothetical protein
VNCLNSKERKCGQGQNLTADTRIFSPLRVPALCVTIGRQLNESNSFCWLRYESIYRFEHIVAYGSGKVVAKSREGSFEISEMTRQSRKRRHFWRSSGSVEVNGGSDCSGKLGSNHDRCLSSKVLNQEIQ